MDYFSRVVSHPRQGNSASPGPESWPAAAKRRGRGFTRAREADGVGECPLLPVLGLSSAERQRPVALRPAGDWPLEGAAGEGGAGRSGSLYHQASQARAAGTPGRCVPARAGPPSTARSSSGRISTPGLWDTERDTENRQDDHKRSGLGPRDPVRGLVR